MTSACGVHVTTTAGELPRGRAEMAGRVEAPYIRVAGTWIATMADPDNNYFQLMTPFDPSQMG